MNKLILIAFILLHLSSCKQNIVDEPVRMIDEKEVSKAFVKVNKSIVKRNRNHTVNFIKRTGWDMNESVDGIWFGVLQKGEGRNVKRTDELLVDYSIRLIDGSYPYEGSAGIVKKIIFGQSGLESGFEKGLMLMHEGDSARIIVPPYLGHGNFGDMEKIPPGAILIFDVRLIKFTGK